MALNILFLCTGIGLFGGLFHSTSITTTFHVFLYIISVTIVQLTAFYPRKLWIKDYSSPYYIMLYKLLYKDTNVLSKMGQAYTIIEYPLILLFIITGGIFVMSSSDIVSIFLSIELQSYGLYLLSTIYKDSELATSGGLTYFLLGGLSSCFILLGTSVLYANSGTTSFEGYYVIAGVSNVAEIFLENFSWYKPAYLHISLLIMSIGFLFKISAAPFHFWSPDVYDSIPTTVTTFVAITAKISILIFLLELVHYTSDLAFTANFVWTDGLLLSSFISLIVGAVLGLSETRIKRLFAYSTISHLGFILLAMVINTVESVQAFIFYLMQYTLSNLNAFIILIAMGFSLYPYVSNGEQHKKYEALPERNNSPIQLTEELKGYFYLNPILALSLVITIFSFIGIPPLIGFFAKQMVLSAALDSGYIFLTIVAILTSVVSAGYYLNIIKQVFFDDTCFGLNQGFLHTGYNCTVVQASNPRLKNTIYTKYKIDNVKLSSFLTVNISVLTLVSLLFMFASNEWLSMTRLLSLYMFNP